MDVLARHGLAEMNKHKPNLFKDGVPKYIRCYDNQGETFDRYTAVFTGRYRQKTGGVFWYVGMSEAPFHPQGFGQHGETDHQPADRPTSGHLGRKINFRHMPTDCQRLVIQTYCDLWDTAPATP